MEKKDIDTLFDVRGKVALITGAGSGMLMQWWMNAESYPYHISGKPLFGLPANIPVTFELTILLSALTAFFAMWSLNGLPKLFHPLFRSRRFRRATSDRFFIVVEAADPQFDAMRTRRFLEGLGGTAVEAIEE